MSVKSFIQIIIIIIILSILGGVYYKYFQLNKDLVQVIDSSETEGQEKLKELEKKILNLELQNSELNNKLEKNKNTIRSFSEEGNLDISKQKVYENSKTNEGSKDNKNIETDQIKKENIIKKDKIEKKDIKNLVKDVEYTSIDQKGNRFHLLASSGKSNMNNSDILDLINVRGKITSETRDTIYIVSDFAQYNSVNLNSKFYENVIINYQDKEITCLIFNINMETNLATAYNDVLIKDPKSIMKAGIVEFDLTTKNININPENVAEKVEVVTN